jgi:tetratricopeptide (TPR) repeat protein
MPLPRFVRNLQILVKFCRYNTDVSSIPLFTRVLASLSFIACAACVSTAPGADSSKAPETFYTVTGEIALSRHEPRVAALEYVAASETDRNPSLLQHATQVTEEALQPSLTAVVADRWIDAEPASLDARRAAGRAALTLFKIDRSAAYYRTILATSSLGTGVEFATLETELASSDNVYGARQLADKLAGDFPDSAAALRMQAFAALRADDPAAAVRSFNAALARSTADPIAPKTVGPERSRQDDEQRAAGLHEMTLGLWRARILSGDSEEPLAQGRALLEHENTPAARLDYALLLLAAQQNTAAAEQLSILSRDKASAPVALRLLGLLDFQDDRLDEASVRFAELLATGKFLDDALYYLGLIAERHGDLERALRFYAQVQNGDYTVTALLRAATILRAHGAAPAAEDLLDRLVEEEPARAPEILASRARIYADAGDAQQASAVLDRASLQYPDSVELRYAMASLLEEQGKVPLALRELKAVMELRPNDPAALNAYGYTLADHGRDLGVARKLIERAHASAPKSAAILDSYGWVLFRQGHNEDALTYLNAAYADDRGADIAAHYGEVLWHLGKQADADRIWTEGGRSDPDNALLKATRLRLHAAH